MLWDIFCKVIDNHGDIGVCWRLSVQLAARGQSVRLWVDDPSALAWMAPQGHPGVAVARWKDGVHWPPPGDVVVEAFGCELDEAFTDAIARRARADGRQPAWINLEYLSAEGYVERSHGLPSPVMRGAAAGLCKHFFYPGFTPRTGGLLREADLARRQAAFMREDFLRGLGVAPGAAQVVSMFCYEPPALAELLGRWAAGPAPTQLLVAAGRATEAARAAVQALDARRGWNAAGRLAIHYLPWLTQDDFDHLLWASDVNFVRGEDSLVRALWAGRPLVWHIYPQHDDAHRAKLQAFLDWLQPSAALQAFHLAWNGFDAALPPWDPAADGAQVRRARDGLLAQDDLVTQLQRFVAHVMPEAP